MRRNVLLLALCQALMMSGNSLLITATALVGLKLAPLPQWATVPFAMMFLGVIVTTYPASLAMQHIGRRTGFTIGAVLGICGGLMSSWSVMQSSFWGFCVGSVLLGSFNAFGQYYRFAAAEAASERYRSRAISYVLAGGVVAAFIGPNLARVTRETLAAEFAGSFACIAALYCCSLLLLQGLRLNQSSPEADGRPEFTVLDLLKRPQFLTAAVSGMVGYGVMNLLMTATPMAMSGHGYHFDQTASVIQWHVVGMFAPAFFTGHLIERVGVYPVMITGTLLLLASCIVNLLGSSPSFFTISLVLLGIGWNFCFIGATSLLTQDSTSKGKVQGLNDLLVFFTVGLTALLSGQLHHYLGWRSISMSVIPVILAVTILLVISSNREKRPDPAS